MEKIQERLIIFSTRFARAASASAVVVGSLVVIGWLFAPAALRSVSPARPVLSTALGLALLGIALRFACTRQPDSPHHRLKTAIAISCSMVVMLMAGLALSEDALNRDLGLDRWLLPAATGSFSGRMATTTALNLFLIGLAGLLLNAGRGIRLAQFTGLTATFTGVLAITGYVFFLPGLYSIGSNEIMSAPIAVISLALGIGVLFARPDRGLMLVLGSPGAGGVVLRRFLPLAIGLPFLLVLLGRMAQLAGVSINLNLGGNFGTLIFLFAGGLLFAVPIVWAVSLFYRIDNDVLRRADKGYSELIESERDARKNAEAANLAKDEFLATLSHELRTPLTAITGWVGLLRRSAVDEKTLFKGLEVIDRNVRAQARLVDDLLNVSSITTGNLKMEAEWIDAVSLIRIAIDSIRPATEAKSIEIVTNLDQDVGLIHADPARWQQTLWNLLTNAMKFTPQGGRITVDFGIVGGWIQLSVTDTGEGIDAAFLPRVFNRFAQADSSSTRRHGGLGLGLAIARHIVELHGGKVMVHSEGRGKGSTFTVQLPVPLVRPVNSKPVTHKPERLEGLRVMLVEDDEDTRDVVGAILQGYGAWVVEAASAAEALSLLAKESPDVLVTDIGMPGMDGYELLSTIRSEHSELHLPVIALTAFASSSDKERSLRAGFGAHVAKPIAPEELVAAIGALASNNAA